MTNVDKTVCVTGASGYIASWIVKYLLEEGYTVRGTVRDRRRKTAHLLRLAEESAAAGGHLELLEADLLKPGSFDEAVRGCSVVYHTASPFFIAARRGDPRKVFVEPAVEGTRNVLEACLKPAALESLRRVVVTSSIVAVFGDFDQKDCRTQGAYTEADWNTTSSLRSYPYAYSKVRAEQTAWDIAQKKQPPGRKWDLVTVLPGAVLGPSLNSTTESGTVELMQQLLSGQMGVGTPDILMPVVDVRDVARAHIRAGADRKNVPAGRYVVVAKTVSMLDVADMLRPDFGGKTALPKRVLPKWLFYVIGPFVGISGNMVRHRIGVPLQVDNSNSRSALQLEYRPVQTTVLEHARQMVADGIVKVK